VTLQFLARAVQSRSVWKLDDGHEGSAHHFAQ
jgi:hypothetical protein